MTEMSTRQIPLKPFCNIMIHEKLKLYILLTDEEIGDGDTYVLKDLRDDGWSEFCTTQRGHKKATRFMEEFYPEYEKYTYRHQQVTLKEVAPFINRYHRHHLSPQGCNFALCVRLGDEIIGAITAGRPVSRHLDKKNILEITRVCVKPGYRNLCSYLYSHMIRVARDLGYDMVITYTMDSEDGASLKAAGFTLAYLSRGGHWSCKTRPRNTMAPEGPKKLWQYVLKEQNGKENHHG